MKNFTYTFNMITSVSKGREFHINIKYGDTLIETKSWGIFDGALDFIKRLEDAKIHREIFHD